VSVGISKWYRFCYKCCFSPEGIYCCGERAGYWVFCGVCESADTRTLKGPFMCRRAGCRGYTEEISTTRPFPAEGLFVPKPPLIFPDVSNT
jgi:hypothetical protein